MKFCISLILSTHTLLQCTHYPSLPHNTRTSPCPPWHIEVLVLRATRPESWPWCCWMNRVVSPFITGVGWVASWHSVGWVSHPHSPFLFCCSPCSPLATHTLFLFFDHSFSSISSSFYFLSYLIWGLHWATLFFPYCPPSGQCVLHPLLIPYFLPVLYMCLSIPAPCPFATAPHFFCFWWEEWFFADIFFMFYFIYICIYFLFARERTDGDSKDCSSFVCFTSDGFSY